MPALESLPGALLTRVFGHRPAHPCCALHRRLCCGLGDGGFGASPAPAPAPAPLSRLVETVALVMVALVRRPLLPCSSLAQSPPRPRTDLLLYALRYRIRREALELQGRPRRDRVRPQSCCLGGGHSAGELGSRSRRLSPLSVPTSPCVHCLRTAPCRGA